MSASQKRKFSEHIGHNAYKKKIKTEERLHEGVSSPQGENITFSGKCTSKNGGTKGQTPSVAYFFKKTKMSPPQKPFEGVNCAQDKKLLKSRNNEKKINENRMSEKTTRNVIDVHLSIKAAFNKQKNWENDTLYSKEIAKCEILPSTNKWSDLNCSIVPNKKSTISNIVKDEVVTSKEMFSSMVIGNTHQYTDLQSPLESNCIETKNVNKKNVAQICGSSSLQKISSIKLQQPKLKYSGRQVSKILHPKRTNFSSLTQENSGLPGNEIINKKFAMKNDSTLSNIKHSRVTNEYVSQENQHFEKTQEFHSMYYTMFQNIRKSSFPFISPIDDQIKSEENVNIANILYDQCNVEKKSLLGDTKDFHSMYSISPSNKSLPFLFPIKEGRNEIIEEKPPARYLANSFKEHTQKSLHYLESPTVLKKMSSFENFIENFSCVSGSSNFITINFSDSILPCENGNISSNKNAIIQLTSTVPETNDKTLMGGSAKLVGNLGNQSTMEPLKNTSKTVGKLNIDECVNSIRNIESIPKKPSLNDLNKLTTKTFSKSCTNKNSISNTKIIRNKNNTMHRLNSEKGTGIKSCILPSFERNKTEFACVSTSKGNMNHSSANDYDCITQLSDGQYNNEKSTQSNRNRIVFDKCKKNECSSITSHIKKSINRTHKKKIPQKDCPFQQYQDEKVLLSPQNINYDRFHSNLIKYSIDSESDNQNNFEQKQFSPIKNSILHKDTNREIVNLFGDLNLNIFESCDITSPILAAENVYHIQNSATYNMKSNESMNMSKTHCRVEILLDEENQEQTETENCSKLYVPSNKQGNKKMNDPRFNHSRYVEGGVSNKNTKMECSPLINKEICCGFSRLQNSINNIVQNNSAGSVHDKLRNCSNTNIFANEDRIETSSSTGSKHFDFAPTSPDITNKIPILNEIGIDVVRKGSYKFSNFEKSSITENVEQILQVPEGDLCKKMSNGVKKCNLKPDFESNSSSTVHGDVTHCDDITEFEIYNKKSVTHSETPCSTILRDTVVYENIYPPDIPADHSFSQHEYDLLKKTSSPLLSDLECRSYLKSLINTAIPEKSLNSTEVSVFETKQRDSEQQSSFISLKEMENKTNIEKSLHNYADSQTKELNQFFDNISSQNDCFNCTEENSSQNIASVLNYDECFVEKRSFFNKNSNAMSENISQESEAEILNHILSQNFTESDTLFSGVLKNMTNLSQKSMKQRNSLHNFNQNSNKLLELALMMYKQFKTNVILSNKEKVIFTQPIRSQIEVERNGSTRIYRLKENSNDELIILDINSNSNNSQCESYNYSNVTSNETDKKILQGLYAIYQNGTFLYKKEDDGLYFSRQNKISIINKIEEIFEDVLEKLADNKSPELRIRRQTFEDCLIDKKMLMLKFVDNPRIIKIHYKNVLSQPKFCLIMYVLAKSLELLRNNTKSTKREIYYQIKSLVSDQGKINSAIKAVSCMLLVGPWDLNIIAHKGMVFGDLKIKLSSNEIINCNVPGTLIPNDIDDFVEIISSAYFILVVEKESIYYKLLEEDLPNRLVKSFIMITGKGFPDLNTQIFLRKLWMVMSLPIFILTDADPHGVNIMITYRFGSLANAHISNQLSVPKAKWLGVFPSEITKFDAEKQPLTDNEKFVIKNILKTPYMTDNPRIEAELKIMLELGYKAGIEGIIKNDTFLSEFYFPMKFYNQDLI